MKIELVKATGYAMCRGEVCQSARRASNFKKRPLIPKNDIDVLISGKLLGNTTIKAHYCKSCVLDVFNQFESVMKEAGLYDKAILKSIMK